MTHLISLKFSFSYRLKLLCTSAALGAGLLLLSAAMAATEAKEYQIKAAFLYNFVNFISWPESAFENDSQPYLICILGQDPFGYLLDLTTENVTAKNRKLSVKRFEDGNHAEINTCHILFISTSLESEAASILAKLAQKPVLTVSEIENFVFLGGLIEFYTVRNKIRLKINREELEAVGLKAAGALLDLANICNRQGCQQ